MTAFIDTKPGYRVFCEVDAQHGPRLSDLASSCGLPGSRTKKILTQLIESGDVRVVDKRFYLAGGGINRIARYNRSHHQAVTKSITPAPAPGGAKSVILDKHDDAVNKVVRRFQDKGFDVWDGRRMGIGAVADPELWFPDLWVNIDALRDRSVLHAVRVDPSTQSGNPAKEIVRDYRRAASRDPVDRPLLLIARDAAAAELFGRAGDDLYMMVTHLGEFFDGNDYGRRSELRYDGRVWDIRHLARMIWVIDDVIDELKMSHL